MNYVKRVLYYLIGFSTFIGQGIAGNNPIGWSLDNSFPDPVETGVSYSITYTFINKLPVQLRKPLIILKAASPASNFAYADNCTGSKLARGGACTVTVSLNALTVGLQTMQLSIAGYDSNVVKLPEQRILATTSGGGGGGGDVIGAATQRLPSRMSAGSLAPYTFTFTNRSQTNATNLNISVAQTAGTVTPTPNSKPCQQGMTLSANDYCLVTGTYIAASSPSSQRVSATLRFNGATGSPVNVSTSTTVQAPSAPIVGSVLKGIPGLMLTNTQYPVKFLFTNTTIGTTFNLDHNVTITCSKTGAGTCPTISSLTGSCFNADSIIPNSQCELDAFINEVSSATTPPTTYTFKASLPYTGAGAISPATVSTIGTVLSSIPQNRIIKIENKCGFKVWYSLNGGAMPAPYSSSNCPSNIGNPSGAYCYFKNHADPTVVGNGLDSSHSAVVSIPADNAGGIQWSGNISASLGCSGSTCAQAACGNAGGTTSCAVGIGFNQPATQAEITMSVNSTDSYDVEVINGFHIPISMTPYTYISDDGLITINAQPSNYSCGSPGNDQATNGFGACNWGTLTYSSLPNPSYYYYWVGKGTGTSCSSNPCPNSELCGLTQLVPNSSITGPVCGKFLGYWTPNELCGQKSNLSPQVISGLKCNEPTYYSSSVYPNTFTSLMQCPVPPQPPGVPQTNPTYNTCYYTPYPAGSSVTQCCGCVDWWDQTQTNNIPIQANSEGSALTCPSGQTNPLWTANIQPGIQWMKRACPNVYVYPFDDGSSSFICSNSGGTAQSNTTSYVVTFCPGNSGKPSGAAEGRG